MPGIDLVADHLGVKPENMLKTVVFTKVGGDKRKWVLATVRGNHDVNEGKVRDAVGFPITLADEKEAKEAGFAIGYVSPRMAVERDDTLLVIDPDATGGVWATGADEKDHHVTGFIWHRDLGADLPTKDQQGGKIRVAEVRNAIEGDPSPRSPGANLVAKRGIEVGHIFKLGTKYAQAFDFTVLNEQQKKTTVIMGCYGIGVSRTIAASIEQSHDDWGIIWPVPIAPYHVVITVMDPKKQEQADLAEKLATELVEAGADVLIDDRNERPGVKFKDADLIGLPVRLTIGDKAMAENCVEFKLRSEEGKGRLVDIADAVQETLSKLV